MKITAWIFCKLFPNCFKSYNDFSIYFRNIRVFSKLKRHNVTFLDAHFCFICNSVKKFVRVLLTCFYSLQSPTNNKCNVVVSNKITIKYQKINN